MRWGFGSRFDLVSFHGILQGQLSTGRDIHDPGIESLVCLPRTTETDSPSALVAKIRQRHRFLRPPAFFLALKHRAEPAPTLCTDKGEVLEDSAGAFMADPDSGNSDADDGKDMASAENTKRPCRRFMAQGRLPHSG